MVKVIIVGYSLQCFIFLFTIKEKSIRLLNEQEHALTYQYLL